MAAKLSRSFIKNHRRFVRFKSGLRVREAEKELRENRNRFPLFRFEIKRDGTDSYSVGRTAKPERIRR